MLTDNAPSEFFIPRNREKYLDMNNTLLNLRVKTINVDGSNLALDVAMELINYPHNIPV